MFKAQEELLYGQGGVAEGGVYGYSRARGTATHSSVLAWRISWTEEPGGPQSIGSQRVGHD